MYVISKTNIIHIGIEAEDTLPKIPAGIYTVFYNQRDNSTTYAPVERQLSNYVDVNPQVRGDIEDEVSFFFTQTKQRGILVHGGPGNGKTRMITEIINKYCQENDAIAIVGPDLDYMPQIVNSVRKDDPDRPIIIFWDEFDEIHDREEYSLLRFLDGNSSVPMCLSIGALNDLDDLEDRVYKRPGRFGLVIELPNPDFNARLQFALQEVTDVETCHKIARATDGLSLDYVREVTMRYSKRGQGIEEIFKKLALDLPEDYARSDT